jgi:hypothetical protein
MRVWRVEDMGITTEYSKYAERENLVFAFCLFRVFWGD